MRKLLSWFDRNVLKLGVGFLIFFIPLWPKLPLLDIPHTWVYIRLEDVLLLVLVLIFFLKLLQKKVGLATPLTLSIFIYWLVGGVSLAFSLIFLAQSLPNFFPHVAVLHWLRRIEYMVIFFIAFATIKSYRDISHYLIILVLTILGIILYGFGQKFFGLPAFLTMNEEFAKGIPLYLPPTARITSTFAGHYDLAAYLVFVIAILGSLIFGVKRLLIKTTLFVLTFFSLILLLLTASRVSFAVYLITVSTMLWWQKKKILIVPVILFSFLAMNFVSGTGERFFKTLQVKQVVYDLRTGKPIATVKEIEGEQVITEEEKSPAEESLPIGSGYIGLPVAPLPAAKTMTVAFIKKQSLATGSGEVATISGSFLIQKALVYDISFTTRFQGEWPRALAAFKRNPLLGSGYSAINLATDNDYLRILGETGLFGFFSFLFLGTTLAIFIKFALPTITSPLVRGLTIGVAAGLVGLAVNAVLIDVFEASKIAFSLWLILGITLGGLTLGFKGKIPLLFEIKKLIGQPLVFLMLLFTLTFVFFGQSLSNYFVGDDFTWLRWAAQSTINDLPTYFTQAAGFFYRPLQKILYFASFTFFWLMPEGYHFLSLLVHFLVASFLYLFVLKITNRRLPAVLTSLFFLVFPSHGESLFWISTLGHTLSTLLIIVGLYCFILFRQEKKKSFYLFSLGFLILSLFAYEGAVVGPLLLLWFEATLGKKKLLDHLPFLILIPLYLLIRTWTDAHGLSGDYSYNWLLLPANFVGNLFGYLGLIFLGSNFTSVYEALRLLGQTNKDLFLILASGLLLVGSIALKRGLTWWEVKPGGRLNLVVFSLGFIPIALLPFLGLGNIAERYAYLASVGGALWLGWTFWVFYQFLKKRKPILGMMTLILLISGLTAYYLTDLDQSQKDWQRAGEITRKILLNLRKNYLTFTFGKTFYFVDMPIREGRAWVFPVGLPDAIWHTFRDETLKVDKVKTLEEALDLKETVANSHVFIFEEGEIKEVVREVKEVPIEE